MLLMMCYIMAPSMFLKVFYLRFQDEDDLIDDQLSALLPFIEENKDTQDVVSKDADEDVGVDYFSLALAK
jgi:hypothetical protein